MDEDIGLDEDELDILRMALAEPIRDPGPELRQHCINLRARRLLQRGGPALPRRTFCLSPDGWNRVMADRARHKPAAPAAVHVTPGRHDGPAPVVDSLVGVAVERAWILVRRVVLRAASAQRRSPPVRLVRD